MKTLIYLLIPFALVALNAHLLFPDPVGFHTYTAGQYAVTLYAVIIAIAKLNRLEGANTYRMVYPLLILCFFAFCLVSMIGEEILSLNRWRFSFTKIRFVTFAALAMTLTVFSAFRVRSLRKSAGPLRPETVYIISYPPSTPLAWMAAVLCFQDRIGKAFYYNGEMYLIDKKTRKPAKITVDSTAIIGRARVAGVDPKRFVTEWEARKHQEWTPVSNNCRRHAKGVLKSARI